MLCSKHVQRDFDINIVFRVTGLHFECKVRSQISKEDTLTARNPIPLTSSLK